MLSRYAAPLRDLAAGRVRDYQHRIRRLDDAGWQRYGLLLDTALRLAVDRRFRPGQNAAPVIRFVASVRERYDHTGHDLDPLLAERLIWAALDGTPVAPVEPATIAAQSLLLVSLLDDEGLSPAEIERFLTDADASTEAGADADADTDADPGAIAGREADPATAPTTGSGSEADPVVEAEHDRCGEQADQHAELRYPGRGAGLEPGLAPDAEHEIAGEERHRRQPGAAPREDPEVGPPVALGQRDAGADQQHQVDDADDAGAARIDGDRPGQR